MTLLERMEQVLKQEHQALVRGDWKALEECVLQKQQLSEELEKAGLDQESKQRLQQLRQSVIYNTELASVLSRNLKAMISEQRPAMTYTGYGRVTEVRQTMVHLRG